MLTVGDKFPSYLCKSCCGNTPADLKTIGSDDVAGKWKLFVFYPKDFTFVCPTELVEFSDLTGEFEKLNVQLYGASTDNEYSKLAWRNSHPQLSALQYPLLAANKLARELGILVDDEVCLRATFLVDPDGVIQHVTVNPLKTGRNPNEMLRVIHAIQSGELTPCSWKPGDAPLKV